MKIFKIKYSLMLLLFLFVSSFIMVSCNKDNGNNLEEHVMTNTVADDEVSARKVETGTPDDNPKYEAYYTRITCSKTNTGNIELREYFKDYDMCDCYSYKWRTENCDQGAGSAVIYNYCDRRNTSTRPFDIICDDYDG